MVSDKSRYASIINGTLDALTEIFTSSKSTSRNSVELVHRRRDHRFGRDATVAFGHRRIERTRVHADTDGNAARFGLGRDELDVLGLADVARIQAQRLHAGLERAERELVLEVDVGDDRHRRTRHDLRQPLGRFLFVARAADDVAAGRGQRVDLRQRAVDVGRLRGGHRLDRDRCVAADGDPADHHLAGLPTRSHPVSLRLSRAGAPPVHRNLHVLIGQELRRGSRPGG